MHIIAGDFKGRVLKVPKSKMVRPTREIVRKAVFDVLGDLVAGKDVLDLFSGSGAFGFEALSRGAKRVSFVENKKVCLRIIKTNISILGVNKRCKVIAQNVFHALNAMQKKELRFQIIFADPPYYQDLAKKCLLKIGKYDILSRLGFLIIEHYKRDDLPAQGNALTLWKHKKYGDTSVSFYQVRA